ncbi:MFS transporter [Halostreptopolyspora alba]|uniref:MFS transporter n=2 Tax=Halostreptopolyspora alba TaxID=2487137 RepID=A0A3N0EFT2_9ACTN|nr:MFS transporter [Nocardiopsaceae bacterium YIM 96095]
MASVLTTLGGTALHVALPEVVRQTHAGATAANWILLAFQLTTTVLMVTFGRLADLFGRRAMYLGGLAVYTSASLLAGFSPDAWLIVALRVAQAVGGAMLLTNSAALVADAFPRARLGEGMGIYTASFSVAQLAGPTLGGLLAETMGWRWVFWYNVPLGLACLLWGALVLRRVRPNEGERGLDIPGNILVFVSLGGLLLAMSEVTRLSWNHPLVLAGFVAFAVVLPLFVLRELWARNPVVDVRMFREPLFALTTLSSLLTSVSRIGVVFLVALFFQAVHGETATQAGLRVLPLPVAAMTASILSGFLQRRYSPRALALLGSALSTGGLAVLGLVISPAASALTIMGALVLLGIGSGMFLPANTTVLLRELPENRLGIVNAMRLMLQNTGVVLGTAMALSIVTIPLPAALHDQVFAGTLSAAGDTAVGQLVTGYHWALGCMTGVSAVATLACLARHRLR